MPAAMMHDAACMAHSILTLDAVIVQISDAYFVVRLLLQYSLHVVIGQPFFCIVFADCVNVNMASDVHTSST